MKSTFLPYWNHITICPGCVTMTQDERVVHEYLFYEKEKCVDLIMYYCFWVELEGVIEVVMI